MVELQDDAFMVSRGKDVGDWRKAQRQKTEEILETKYKQRNIADDSDQLAMGEKEAGAWSAQATSQLIQSFQDKRMAKKQVDVDWRIFRSEDWEAVADRINHLCGSTATSFRDGKTGKQCQYKIGNLKRRFKSETTKGGVSDWRWFPIMQEIFAGEMEAASKSSSHREKSRMITDHCLHPCLIETVGRNKGAGENRLHVDEPTSCNIPTSKSASTTDMDRRYAIAGATNSDSGPSSPHYCKQLVTSILSMEHIVRKRSSSPDASPSETLAGSINKSMKMMAMQQGEMMQLMREIVETQAVKTSQSHIKAEAVENFVLRKEAAHLRKKVEIVERDMIPLKQLCEQKEKELKNALQAYNEKQDLRSALYSELMEVINVFLD